MSHLFTMPSLELLLILARGAAIFVGFVIFGWAFRHWRRAAIQDTQRVFEQLDLVRSELLIMKEVMHHSTQRGERPQQASFADMRSTVASAIPVSSAGGRGYEMAARMARNGAAKDDLIRNCGVTPHEAELLIRLHGHRHDAAELIGRRPRTNEASSATRQTTAAERKPLAPNSELQPPSRGSVARDTARPAAAASARSRLVAVG